MAQEKNEIAKSLGFPCKSCGSLLEYSPERGKLFCEYCKGEEDIPSEKIEAPEYLYDPTSETASAPNWEEEGDLSLICPSCGAETVTAAIQHSVSCPFCGSHYVCEPTASQRIIRPETLIPFRIGKAEAKQRFHKWAKRRLLAPNAFRRAAAAPDMQGVYLPHFTFDTDLFTAYRGEGGRTRVETYTVRVNGKTQTRTRTYTVWYPIAGSHRMQLDDLPFCASGSVDTKLLDKIRPFSGKVLNVYNPAFLAGFVAERYSLGPGEGFAEIKGLAERRMAEEIKRREGYDSYRLMSYDHTYNRVLFKHILLPVWMSTYRFREKAYPFFVNGETGKAAGKAPLSPLKVALLALFSIGLIALLSVLFAGAGESLLIAPPSLPELSVAPLSVGALYALEKKEELPPPEETENREEAE